jgi:hypothetical protein
MKPDVVYHYHKGKYGTDTEIRYSIRSIEKYLDFNKLIIRGDLPSFANREIKHLNVRADKATTKRVALFKHLDMLAGARAIINDKKISDDFYWMNDDFYLMKPYKIFPYFYNGTITEWNNRQDNWGSIGGKRSNVWQKYINEIHTAFPDGLWYEVHCPILFNKQKLELLLNKYELQHVATIRSYYGNEYKVGGQNTSDYKLYRPEQIKKYKDAPFLSSSNGVQYYPEYSRFMKLNFNKPSKYEKI